MVNPNIAAVSSFTLESVVNSIASTAAATALSNAADSGEVLEVYSALFANIDGADSVDVTLELVKAAGAVAPLVFGITVDAQASEVVISKEWPVVLQEGDYLRRSASVGGAAAYTISFRRYTSS